MPFVDARDNDVKMWGYIRENSGCTDWNKYPSKKVIKRYNLRTDSILLQWWLLEQYFEGNLIEKPKDEPQPK